MGTKVSHDSSFLFLTAAYLLLCSLPSSVDAASTQVVSKNWPKGTAPVTAGTLDAVSGFPTYLTAASGASSVKLEQCLSKDVKKCLPMTLPNPDADIAFPDNYPDEQFYYIASFAYNAGSMKVLLEGGVEGAFLTGFVEDKQQMVFSRLRVRITPLPPAGDYTLQHPWGDFKFTVPAGATDRRLDHTEDRFVYPLIATGVASPVVRLLLPSAAMLDSEGYFPNIPTPIQPGPSGRDYVALLDGSGAIIGAKEFQPTITGKVAAMAASRADINFGSQTMNTASAPVTVTLTNKGAQDVKIMSLAIQQQGTVFKIATSTATANTMLSPGQSASISVTCTPTSTASVTGMLTISGQFGTTAGNTLGQAVKVPLMCSGSPASTQPGGTGGQPSGGGGTTGGTSGSTPVPESDMDVTFLVDQPQPTVVYHSSSIRLAVDKVMTKSTHTQPSAFTAVYDSSDAACVAISDPTYKQRCKVTKTGVNKVNYKVSVNEWGIQNALRSFQLNVLPDKLGPSAAAAAAAVEFRAQKSEWRITSLASAAATTTTDAVFVSMYYIGTNCPTYIPGQGGCLATRKDIRTGGSRILCVAGTGDCTARFNFQPSGFSLSRGGAHFVMFESSASDDPTKARLVVALNVK